MKIIFCSSNTIGSKLIRMVTWSKHSHVALVNGDEVIEATYPKVKVTPLNEILSKHTNCVIVDIPCDDNKAIEAAKSQIGKPYDLKGMLGLAFNHDWQDDGQWWCSELVAWALSQGDAKLFRDEVMHRITPQDLWKLNYPSHSIK